MKYFLISLQILFYIQWGATQDVKLNGALSDNHLIRSKAMNYNLQYRVYTPPNYDQLDKLPTIYLTDGQWYLAHGRMHEEIDSLISSGKIEPVIAVFVDSRDPHNLRTNRRNGQFLGVDRYVNFFSKELVPEIDKSFKTSRKAKNRAIMGLSFGGLNAAYFGAKAWNIFHLIGIQSPALHPVPEIYDLYSSQYKLPLKVFLSTGTVDDKEYDARKLKEVFDDKGYKIKYIEVEEGHDWRNWKPLQDDALIYFFGNKNRMP